MAISCDGVLEGCDGVRLFLIENGRAAFEYLYQFVLPDFGGDLVDVVQVANTCLNDKNADVEVLSAQATSNSVTAPLKALYNWRLSAAHKAGVAAFSDAVTNTAKASQTAGRFYEFPEIVDNQKRKTLEIFRKKAQESTTNTKCFKDRTLFPPSSPVPP
ncbi:hypothetical protein QBC33DRAFT_520098 [Phialemonium atrogriseum]|uniref:Sey1/RHD3-like three-helix bundle domain-containing protein n=1 Tax=Phialemonium atrogriseum TaxID=1093897 RepID=A0AAJ0BP80_9PEZI|nr:uncharacterized protein QBC33DRAFT_520098 [Phialemonium atrogriseum]KAK1761791.1 hypothetical protein QBC33DRAFT_520098 [Phialemonium atrogriseum]